MVIVGGLLICGIEVIFCIGVCENLVVLCDMDV